MTRIRFRNCMRLIAHILTYVTLTNVLVHSYLEYLIPVWGYLGYSSDYSLLRHILANAGSILLAMMVPRRITGLTSFTLSLVASSTLVAMLAMYAARGFAIGYLIAILVFFLIVKLLAERLRFRIPPRKSSLIPVVAVSGGIFGVCIAWIAARGGLSGLTFDLARIYSVREIAMDRYFVGPFAYLINWSQKVFGTTLLALGITQGYLLLVILAISGQVFFYVTLGQKLPIAMIVFVLLAIVVARYRPGAWLLNVSLICAVIVTEVLFEFGVIYPAALLVTRIFFGPAGNNILFFEFFSENSLTYFSTTFLRGVVEYPYEMHVFDLISIFRTGDVGITPNTGVFGTGYMHMGYLGLFTYAVSSGLILSVAESLSKAIPNWVPLAIAGPPMYILFTAADLPVALMTNGGFWALVILFLWPSTRAAPR